MRSIPAIVAIIVLLTLGLGFVSWSCLTKRGPLGALWDIHKLTSYKDFVIDGEVFGEDGSPLSGVMVNIEASRKIKAGTDSKSDETFFRLGGSKFHIQKDNYSSICVNFMREGYVAQSHEFLEGGTYRNVKVVLKQVSGKQNSVPERPHRHEPQ